STSYLTQRGLFLLWDVDPVTSGIAPIAVDLLAIICTLAVHAEGIARKGHRAAVVVLVITGSASVTANFLAGATPGSKAVHAAMVVLYLLAEWIAAQVKGSPEHTTPHAPAAAPTSPGMPPAELEPPEVLAYREAAAELRRTSSLAGLNPR
ncbi:MAG TPA: hypothetical protein VFU23_03275, partial [Gemmatimonadales bacterium]|nr:hypothetical protein [Gemmatimonadales bacterium]